MDEKTRILKEQIAAIKDEVSKVYEKISVLEKTIGGDDESPAPKKKTMQKVKLSGI